MGLLCVKKIVENKHENTPCIVKKKKPTLYYNIRILPVKYRHDLGSDIRQSYLSR